MKKKRDRTRSSTPSSTGSGKTKTTSKRAILGRLMILEDKVSGLYRQLISGDLGDSVTVKNLVKSQAGLLSELDGIKRYVGDGIRTLEKQRQDAAFTVLQIEHSLQSLRNGWGRELAELRTTLTKIAKQKHGTNKGKKTPHP